MVNNSTNINKMSNHLSPKESLNSDGQQFSSQLNSLNTKKGPQHMALEIQVLA